MNYTLIKLCEGGGNNFLLPINCIFIHKMYLFQVTKPNGLNPLLATFDSLDPLPSLSGMLIYYFSSSWSL